MLSLKQALDIAGSVLAQGRSSGFASLSVAVLDPGAHILAVLRDERASIGRSDIENVLDLTHFGYVHASTFGITDWVDPPE